MEQIIYYIAKLKTTFMNYYSNFIEYIINTKSVEIIDKEGNKKSILSKYLIIYAIHYIISLLKSLRNNLDVNADKIQIVKADNGIEKIIILDSDYVKSDKNYINIKDIINHIDETGLAENVIPCVFLQFELVDQDNPICLKSYMLKYNDHTEDHHHTLENVLTFNDIEPSDDAIVNIKKFSNGIKALKLSYNDCKNKHLSYFQKL